MGKHKMKSISISFLCFFVLLKNILKCWWQGEKENFIIIVQNQREVSSTKCDSCLHISMVKIITDLYFPSKRIVTIIVLQWNNIFFFYLSVITHSNHSFSTINFGFNYFPSISCFPYREIIFIRENETKKNAVIKRITRVWIQKMMCTLGNILYFPIFQLLIVSSISALC